MIDLKVIASSFEKTFLNSFVSNNKEKIVLPELTRKNMCKKISLELNHLNNKYGIEGYGHILYLINEAKSVMKHKDGYVIAIEQPTYNSYVFLDKDLNLQKEGCFFFRNNIGLNRKNALLLNNNKIFLFSQSNENNIFSIEEKESKEQTLSYSSNFSNISLKTTAFSIHTYSLNKIDSYGINIKDGVIRKVEDSIIIKFDNGEIQKNIFSKNIEFKINNSNSIITSALNDKNFNEIIYSYNPISKDIVVTYPIEYCMKNKNEDIKEFLEVLNLLSDNSELPKGSIYLANLDFFEKIFNTIESCHNIQSIITAKDNYDSIFKEFEYLNSEVEKNVSLLNSKVNKLY